MSVNLFQQPPAPLPAELTEMLLSEGRMRIERIVSTGHFSSDGFWYDQADNEWVAVLSGEAVLEFLGRDPIQMNAGDWINIPAHEKHRVKSTSQDEPTIWLAVFYPSADQLQNEATK